MTKDQTARNLERESAAAKDLLAELSSDDAELNHDMTEGETGLFEAIEAALAEIDDCDVTIEGCKAKEKQMADRRKRAEGRQERLRTLIEQAMLVADMPTVKLPCATFSVSHRPPAPFVADEALIPAKFWKQPDPVLDKKAINAASKDGEEIPGVSMTNGSTSLTIRRA